MSGGTHRTATISVLERELVAPAIDVARGGFALGTASRYYLRYVHESVFGWDERSHAALHDAHTRRVDVPDAITVASVHDGRILLLNVLLGLRAPDSGTLVHGENLQVAYFDQNREQLDGERDAAWNIAEGADRIDFDGRSLHVLGYLKAFLFTPDRARTATRLLSGGERNRLLLARLFAKPSNVLVLDEPTNDLDVETLELLEDLILDYPGTVILVSHDRAFVNEVIDGLLVHEGERGFRHYVGDYDDWLRQARSAANGAPVKTATKAAARPAQQASAAPTAAARLSSAEQRELKRLPQDIEKIETRIAALHARMAAPEFYQQPVEEQRAAQGELAQQEAALERAFERWTALEAAQVPLPPAHGVALEEAPGADFGHVAIPHRIRIGAPEKRQAARRAHPGPGHHQQEAAVHPAQRVGHETGIVFHGAAG